VDRARYARHLLLPEVGPDGQARLCAHAVALDGDPRAVAAMGTYLARAGVTVEPAGAAASGSGAAGAGAPSSDAVQRLAGRADLEEAAAFLAGAFTAVEEIKRVLQVGTPGRLDAVRLTGPEDRT
jgi:hypothetical protein